MILPCTIHKFYIYFTKKLTVRHIEFGCHLDETDEIFEHRNYIKKRKFFNFCTKNYPGKRVRVIYYPHSLPSKFLLPALVHFSTRVIHTRKLGNDNKWIKKEEKKKKIRPSQITRVYPTRYRTLV